MHDTTFFITYVHTSRLKLHRIERVSNANREPKAIELRPSKDELGTEH